MTAERGIYLTKVRRRRTPCKEHFEVTLGIERFPDSRPGQFLQVLCRGHHSENHSLSGAFLRRPFSIAGFRRDSSGCELDLMGRVVGEGTAWLNRLSPGDTVDIIGPLGRAFSVPSKSQRAILIAGGIGLPPIRWLGETLRLMGLECTSFYGALTKDLLPIAISSEPSRDGAPSLCVEEFSRHGIPTTITTDDGSRGFRGRVTEPLRRYLECLPDRSASRMYACGPEPMLRAVAGLASEFDVECELAMERMMGCGMGTCQSCVIPVRDPQRAEGWRYALCCTDGPVFDARQVVWR